VAHPTDGGTVLFQLRNLTLMTNGGFNANGLGGQGGGGGWQVGGAGGARAAFCGGGYGGRGGGASGGYTYGNSNAPVECGSGGMHDTGQGAAGGGSVRVWAPYGTVVVNGTIQANGVNGTEGGSGGGI